MANVTWSKTDSGAVQDTQGNTVGTADGAGTITINAGTDVEVGSATASDTLTIGPGVTVKFPLSAPKRGFDVNAGGGSFEGTLAIQGTAAEPVTLTSAEATPAAADWRGIRWVGATTSIGGTVSMTYCNIEYTENAILSSAGLDIKNAFSASFCNFSHFDTNAAFHNAGKGGTFPWTFSYCCFWVCTGEHAGSNPTVNCSSGGLPTGDQRAKIILDHCSFMMDESDANTHQLLIVGARSDMTVTNSILYGKNAGAGAVQTAQINATGGAMVNNNNFVFTDANNQYVPDATDQAVDPSYQDTTCTAPDLAPDGQAGSPDLYLASSEGIYVGAKTPYNLPPGYSVDPEGTSGVWAGRKQRVYEVSFGPDANKTLGRAIRVGVSATDLQGTKLIGGIFLKVDPERLK